MSRQLNQRIKYEEFFLKSESKLCDFQEHLPLIYKNEAQYEGNMYCPECRKAALALYRTETPHLRKKQSGNHEDGCIYECDEASKKQLKEYYTNPANCKNIE